MPTQDLLQAGITAVKAGDLVRANTLLAEVLRTNPRSEQAWLWLGRCRATPEQRAYCFNQVLAINPRNREAREELQPKSAAALPPQAAPPPAAASRPGPAPVPGPEPEDVLSTLRRASLPAGGMPLSSSTASPAKPRRQIVRNPRWLVAGLGVVLALILVGLGVVAFVSMQRGAASDITLIPTLTFAPTRAIPTLTSTPKATATNLFPPEWTKGPPANLSSPTPRGTATTSPEQLAAAKALVDQADQLVQAGQYENAIGVLNQAIVAAPDYGRAYYLRASADNQLVQLQNADVSARPELYQDLADVNEALALDPPSGDYYMVRFHLDETLALISPYRVDQTFWHTQALADVRQANQLGNTEADSERQPPFVLASLGRCQEAQDEVNGLLKTEAQQPSGGLYSALAHSDLCLKDLQNALKHVETAIRSLASPDRLLNRVVILYSLGRWADARAQLDALVKAQPGICPCRYAWRALLDYKLGSAVKAQDDLLAAGQPIPSTEGVDAYIRGLLALKAGDKAGGVQLLQAAEAKLTAGDGPILLEEIQQQLAAAGAAPLSPTLSVPATPAPQP